MIVRFQIWLSCRHVLLLYKIKNFFDKLFGTIFVLNIFVYGRVWGLSSYPWIFPGFFLNTSVTGKNGFGFEGLPSSQTSEAETKVPNQFIVHLISVALITL